MVYNNLQSFLNNITIDASIDSIGQLYSKYDEEAKKINLKDDYDGLKDLSYIALKIELPTLSSERDKHIIVLGDDDRIKNILKEVEFGDIVKKEQQYCVFYSATSIEAQIKQINRIINKDRQPTETENNKKNQEIIRNDKEDIKSKLEQNKSNQLVINQIIEKRFTIRDQEGTDWGPKAAEIVCKEILKIVEPDPINPAYYGFYLFDEDPDQQGIFLCGFVGVTKDEAKICKKTEVNKYPIIENVTNDVHKISALIRNKHLSNLNVLLKRETVKSAKAAIMSRNMSHNLGSHVMFYIKQRLESVEKILDSGALKNLIQASSLDDLEKMLKEVHINNDTKQMPFLVGLGRFINYLQERQDYIATVATDYIPYKTTINFKDAIYDELKPEMHARRHNGDAAGRESANLLLDYIAKSEGFEKSDDIELLFIKDDGTTFNGSGTPEGVPENLRNFNVSLPGGNLGRQAFFSIMENIIRNTAKHDGSRLKGKKLCFQFDRLIADDITNIEGFSYRYREIYEKEPRLNYSGNNCYKEFENDFEYLGITIKVEKEESELDDTINKINKGLTSKYLSNDGQMNDDYKGIKEIRLSAAWLRDEKLDFEMPMNQPPAVSIRKNNIDGVKYLQYVICLPKPKKIAIVSSSLQDAEEYHKQGCMVFKPDNLKGISDYDLVVYHGEESDEGYLTVRQQTGSRIYADSKLGNDWNLDNIYISWLEKAYFERKPKETPTQSESVKLSILDEQAKKNVTNSDFLADRIKTTASSSESDEKYYTNNIVFCTHYPGQAEVEKTNKKMVSEKGKTLLANVECYSKARFVEAITGGNSTDRLIRHDERTVEWYCKQMLAGLTHIAIFDERLYSLIMPLEGKVPQEVQNAVNDVFQKNEIVTLNNCFDYLKSKLNLNRTQQKKLYNNLKNEVNKNNCIQALSSYTRNYSKTWQYREKGIWAFNIKVDNNKTIDIVGYNTSPQKEQIGVYDPLSDEQVIAHISKNVDGKISVLFVDKETAWKNKFDFISIHQGLLDKIYGALGITDENLQEKEKTTKAIFDAFSSKFGSDFVITQENNNQGQEKFDKYFLPQFVIHSGRSKPNRKDMPQNLPFLQFSAIDYAVRDCKYALTELLYSAHYER